MEVEEIDRVGPERFEALVDLGPEAIESAAVPAAFRSHNDMVGKRGERFADRALALTARIEVSGVDVVEPCGDCISEESAILGRVG